MRTHATHRAFTTDSAVCEISPSALLAKVSGHFLGLRAPPPPRSQLPRGPRSSVSKRRGGHGGLHEQQSSQLATACLKLVRQWRLNLQYDGLQTLGWPLASRSTRRRFRESGRQAAPAPSPAECLCSRGQSSEPARRLHDLHPPKRGPQTTKGVHKKKTCNGRLFEYKVAGMNNTSESDLWRRGLAMTNNLTTRLELLRTPCNQLPEMTCENQAAKPRHELLQPPTGNPSSKATPAPTS